MSSDIDPGIEIPKPKKKKEKMLVWVEKWLEESKSIEEQKNKLKAVAQAFIDIAIKEAVKTAVGYAIKQAREKNITWCSLLCYTTSPASCFPSPDMRCQVGTEIEIYCPRCEKYITDGDGLHKIETVTPLDSEQP